MRASRTITMVAVFVLIATLITFLSSDALSVRYHLWRLKSATTENGRAYRSQQTPWDKRVDRFGRTLHIKRESPGIRRAEEKRLLLDMGYLRKVEFPLTNRVNFSVLLTNALRQFPGEWWELGSNPSQTVAIVTAPTNRLAAWQKLVYSSEVLK
jgi:hypothetical protein